MGIRKKRLSKLWKWVIGIILGLAIAVFAGLWYISSRWEPIVKDRLQLVVADASKNLYKIEYSDLNINVLTGSVTLKNLEIIPDSIVYAEMVSQKTADNSVFKIEIGQLKIRGVRIKQLLVDKVLQVRSVGIEQSDVHLTQYHHKFGDSVPESPAKPLYEVLSATLKNVAVEKLDLNSINFTHVHVHDSVTSSSTELKNIRVNIRDIRIDSAAHYDKQRFFYSKSIDLALPGFRYETHDSIHYVAFDTVFYHSHDSTLIVKNFKFEPLISRTAYHQRLGKAKDLIKLEFKTLRFEKLDPNAFIENNILSARFLKIDSGNLDVSNDLRYPRIMTSKIGKAPHQKLMKVNQRIHIDSIAVNAVDISYAEISGKYHKEGKITFNKATGMLYNVTNDTGQLTKDKWMRADLTALLMNTGKLHAVFGFDMLSNKGDFTCRGSLGPMKGKVLNRILTPLLNAEVASANIKGVKFDLKGTDYRNWGSFNFDYDDLKINLLGTESDGERNKKGLISFVANQFLVHSSNPDSKGKYLIARINYKRPPEYSYFKALWKSLLEGIKYSVGIDKEREKKINNVMNFFKNPFGGNKDEPDKKDE